MANSRALPSISLIIIATLAGCGIPEGNSSNQPFFNTIRYIQENGFPTLDELWSPLPSQFSFVDGVESNQNGLPALPDTLAESGVGSSTTNFNALLGEAKTLSAQGFSEARRLEAQVQNVLSPVFNALSQSDLFAQVTDLASGSQLDSPAGFMLQEGSGTAIAGSIFETLFEELSFGVNLGEIESMPNYLIISAKPGGREISIAGLWQDEKSAFNTGFQTSFRINDIDDMQFSIALLPGTMGGMISGWNAQSCADDIYRVSLTIGGASGTTAEVSSHECPTERNSVASLGVTRLGDSFTFQGAFVQSFSGVATDTLRGFLGERQGFVMQATSNGSLSKVAAAAAVLGSEDFAAPTQATVDEFGVGRLLGRYVQAKYWNPLRDAASGSNTNLAYFMCLAPFVSEYVKSNSDDAGNLCEKKDVDVEGFLSALSELKAGINQFDSFVTVPSSIKSTVNGLIDVLTIRNNLFISETGSFAYKNAPDSEYEQLASTRSALGLQQLDSLNWKDELNGKFVSYAAAELPKSPFAAVTTKLTQFLTDQCSTLVVSATTKAKKSPDASACQF